LASENAVWRLGDGRRSVLIVDNYDSFTFNLVQALVVLDARLEVVRNDALSVDAVLARGADAIVLSPGPSHPGNAGICLELLERRPAVPLLGVCLGHQALGQALGATVARAPRLMHGKVSDIRWQQHPMFAGLPNPFVATRYHSLCVLEDTLPEELVALAWSEEGTLQAMAHRELPYWGVQFHPESVLTEVGPRLLENFLEMADAFAAEAASSRRLAAAEKG
jgi:anthranilate synthase/aminodeoxychorismate synthase-like glutamine amidotransferase